MANCVWKKQHTAWGQGKTHVTLCGKPASHVDSNGRALCTHHYNRTTAKQARRNVRQQLERDGIPYGRFLLALRPGDEHFEIFKHKTIYSSFKS